MEKNVSLKCARCRNEFVLHEIIESDHCPDCKTAGTLMSPGDDVTIKINWLELKILGMLSERYAKTIKNSDPLRTLYSIVKGIQDQYPKKRPLTLRSESREINKMIRDLKTK